MWRYTITKRIVDVIVALLALILLSPVMMAIALAIVLESPGPVLYRAERVGYRGRRLQMLKFRKMPVGMSGPLLTVSGDPRLTRLGAILARTRLDELPQLWHVLRGQMSLVGPRPEDPAFVQQFATDYREVLSVRPGVTGWTQLAFADEAQILRRDDPLGHYIDGILPQKVALDRLYAVRLSAACDARIVIATLRTVVLRQPIAVNRLTGRLTWRRRPVDVPVVAPTPAGQVAPAVEMPAAAPAVEVVAEVGSPLGAQPPVHSQ